MCIKTGFNHKASFANNFGEHTWSIRAWGV